MRILLLSGVAVLACASLPAAEPPPEPKPVDLKALPVNQWVERPLSGWPGKTWYGPGIHMGLCSAGDRGMLVFDGALLGKDGQIKDTANARIRKLDLSTGVWSELAASPLEVAFRNKFNYGMVEKLHGIQLCFDADRKVLVGITTTELDGRGRTVEFDLEAKKASGSKPDPSPPVVTAASLCYDPVNKEVVLATGGFSPIGGTDGTWLYDGVKKQWRKLEGPKEVDEVRLPLEAARDRLVALRWLVWKNLELRATGREKLLDERSEGEALAKEDAELAAELKKLGETAAANSAKAERPYHRSCLASAGKLLSEAVAKLSGADAKLKAGSPEEIEALYRGNLVPALEVVEKAISELAVTPEPRMSARLVYDPKSKLIVCFGGAAQCGAWGDTWVYHCEGRWWERRHPTVHPPPMESRALAFDAASGQVVLMQASRWGGKKERLYAYDAGKDEWRCLEVARPGDAFWLEYDAPSGCLVALSHDMNKAWLLRLDPAGAKAVEVQPGPEVALTPTEGDFVLRDVASLADLKKYQAGMTEWVKSIPANTWAKVPTQGTGRPNWGRTWSSIVYDPDRHQIYYRDGGHGSYHGAVTDHYDLATGRWFRSDRRYEPPWPMGSYFGWGRSFSYAPWCIHSYKYGLFYNPLKKRLQRTIGQSGQMEGAPPGAVIEYDPDTGRWARELVPLGAGAGGAFGGGVTVPGVTKGMLSINNFTRYGQKDGEAVYVTKDGAKQWKNLGMLPRAHDDHCFCWFFDPKRNRAMYYGGGKGKPQELFALDLGAEAPKWQKLEVKGAGDGKLPLSDREVVYVSKHDVFLMIAASETPYAKGQFETIWKLDPADNTFSRLELAGERPAYGGVSNGLQYDPVTDLCFYIHAASGAPTMLAFRYAPGGK